MDPEEKNLQIKLGQLQADIQIWLAVCFAFFAAFVAISIASLQEIYATGNLSFTSPIAVCFAGMIIVTTVSVREMKAKRTEMGKL